MRKPIWMSLRMFALGLSLISTVRLIAAEEPAPAAPQPAKVDRVRLVTATINGQRMIRVQDAEKAYIIREENGKNITFSEIRNEKGVPRIESIRAATVEALEKDHPEKAKLYRKYTEEAAKLPPQQIAVPNWSAPAPRATGERQIRATVRGQKIEIDDYNGTRIRMRLIDRTVADAVPHKLEAASLKELQEQDADAAEIYIRLTGQQ